MYDIFHFDFFIGLSNLHVILAFKPNEHTNTTITDFGIQQNKQSHVFEVSIIRTHFSYFFFFLT